MVAITTVAIPVRPIARPLIAPCFSPISTAFVVPKACEEVPIAMPCAVSSVILHNFKTHSAKTAPIIPVIIIAATVTDGIPSICLDNSIPNGVVIDLGIKDASRFRGKPNALERAQTLAIAVMLPTNIPDITAM